MKYKEGICLGVLATFLDIKCKGKWSQVLFILVRDKNIIREREGANKENTSKQHSCPISDVRGYKENTPKQNYSVLSDLSVEKNY